MTFSYDLAIFQEPVRARMCGLGDKDRRQITPPPFIKLNILDPETHKTVNIDDIDISTFVLIVELWSSDEQEDLTLNQNIRNIKNAARSSRSSINSDDKPNFFANNDEGSNELQNNEKEEQQEEADFEGQGEQEQKPFNDTPNRLSERLRSDKSSGTSSRSNEDNLPKNGSPVTSSEGPSVANSTETSSSTSTPTIVQTPSSITIPTGQDQQRPKTDPTVSPTSLAGLSDSDESLGDIPTRNLIGSLVVNPFKLYDDKLERGIWFILQDLSVRIEGEFKLKLTFIDLISNKTVSQFSQPFQVFSAKKFPGVVDSSPLGKVFANQGVKISIRRETKDR